MSTTRLQEVQICFGKGKQTDIATAQAAAVMWRFTKLNAALGKLTGRGVLTEHDGVRDTPTRHARIAITYPRFHAEPGIGRSTPKGEST